MVRKANQTVLIDDEGRPTMSALEKVDLMHFAWKLSVSEGSAGCYPLVLPEGWHRTR